MSGPAILFLHGFAASGSVWRDVVAALPGRHCVTPELCGFGGAEPAPSGWELADWVDEAASFAAPLERFVLVGHSMGGKIATLLASRGAPDLAGLVLVAPSPPTPEPIPDRAAMLAGFGDPAAAAKAARAVSARAGEPRVLERILGDALCVSRVAWTWWIETGSRDDVAAQAADITVPTLVVAAEGDETLPPAVIKREVARRIPGAAFTTLPGSRHMAPIDAPDALAATVTTWMRTAV